MLRLHPGRASALAEPRRCKSAMILIGALASAWLGEELPGRSAGATGCVGIDAWRVGDAGRVVEVSDRVDIRRARRVLRGYPAVRRPAIGDDRARAPPRRRSEPCDPRIAARPAEGRRSTTAGSVRILTPYDTRARFGAAAVVPGSRVSDLRSEQWAWCKNSSLAMQKVRDELCKIPGPAARQV